MDTLIGTSLGGYRLLRLLGSGGMGTVYLAENPVIGQQVAIKVVRTGADEADFPDPSGAIFAAERFKQEARAVANLDHLHILPLYHYGEEMTSDGLRAYMVMQYRPEGSLLDWLRRRAGLATGQLRTSTGLLPPGLHTSWPLDVEETSEYLRQAASALQYAHDRGIIHRDIKTANFLLRFDNDTSVHLLLSDFGLAKFYSTISSTSHIMGTPTYMAPEQFEGIPGPYSDQYSLAVMIYYLLAGRPPFEGEPIHLMHQHLMKEPPAIRRFNPAVSKAVEQTLLRALAKHPAHRYPSVTTFAEAFTQNIPTARLSQGFAPRPFLPRSSLENRYTPLPAQQVAASPPIVQPQTPLPPVPQAMFWAANEAPLQAYRANSPSASLSLSSAPGYITPPPDHVSAPLAQPGIPPPPGQQRIQRRKALGWIIGGVAAAGIVGGTGTGIYFYLRNRLPAHALHILRGHTDSVTSVSWSPNGTLLVSGSFDYTARLWSVANEQNTVTFHRHHGSVLSVAWSGDGHLLASGGEDHTVQVWDTTGTLLWHFANWGAAISSVAWTKDDQGLFVAMLGVGTRELLLNTGTRQGKFSHSIAHAIALSPDGHYLAVALDDGVVTVTDVLTHKTTARRSHSGAVLAVAWSPDSTQLASGGVDAVAQVIDVLTDHRIHSLPHDGPVNGIAWEPANTGRLATASADGNVRIWDVNSSTRTVYGGHGGPVTSVAWGANGLASGSADTTIIIWQPLGHP